MKIYYKHIARASNQWSLAFQRLPQHRGVLIIIFYFCFLFVNFTFALNAAWTHWPYYI